MHWKNRLGGGTFGVCGTVALSGIWDQTLGSYRGAYCAVFNLERSMSMRQMCHKEDLLWKATGAVYKPAFPTADMPPVPKVLQHIGGSEAT